MIALMLLLMVYSPAATSYGYDSGTDQGACGRAYRSSRMFQPPCDLLHQSYCSTAGSMYPWHAVRRFIRENQGLMRRMYGDERHIAVLKAELETNDVNEIRDSYDETRTAFKSRYAKQDNAFENELPRTEEDVEPINNSNNKREDVMNTKFVYSEEPSLSVKLADLKTMPHFRPTSPKPSKVNGTTVNATVAEQADDGGVTETSTVIDDESTVDVEASTEFTTVTEDFTEPPTTTTTTADDQDESTATTTDGLKKETLGAVLFQDAASNNKKVHVNYNVRGVNACPVKEEVVAPFWANNTRGEVLALLNHYPFEQYVHWEKCTYEHRQMYCREGCRCEQKYRLHRLLAFDPNNECKGIFSDWFRFPSCCVCKCYNIPTEFRVTSRSPRGKENLTKSPSVPVWFKKRNERSNN